MQALTLRPGLSESQAEQSWREDRPITDLVSDAVEQYLEAKWHAKLDEELAAYIELHPELVRTHFGAWVEVHAGAVVDPIGRVLTSGHDCVRRGNRTLVQKYYRSPELKRGVSASV